MPSELGPKFARYASAQFEENLYGDSHSRVKQSMTTTPVNGYARTAMVLTVT